MQISTSEYAMIEISVTTACGIVPIEGACVTVSYNTVPGINDNGQKIMITDKNGRTDVFKIPIKRAVVGGRQVDFPRRAECNVEIRADGYVTLRVRAVHLFPNITVVSSFDLMPNSVIDQNMENKKLEA